MSKFIVNIIASVFVVLFLVQSTWDMISINYEVPAAMYGIMAAVVTTALTGVVGIQIGKGGGTNDRKD